VSVKERRRRLTAGERRASILAAALGVFAERGYHRASVDVVVQRAGISKPVLYDHFASKQDLYMALLEEQAGRLFAAVEPHQHPRREALADRLEATARAMFGFAREHADAWQILFGQTVSDPDVAAAYERLRESGARIAAAVTAEDPDFGAPPGVDRDRGALMLGRLQHDAFVSMAQWGHENPEAPLDDLVAVFMDFAWTGLERLRAGEHWRTDAGA